MNEAAIKALRKALKGKSKDTFVIGDVVRWVSGGRYNYAAIKTPVGWFTTAAFNNGYVPVQVTYEELVEILGKSNSGQVEVASEWTEIG